LGAQFEAAFTPGEKSEAPWWRYARHANACAALLRDGLVEMGFEPFGHSASNQQFFRVSAEQERAIADACGCETFYVLDDGTRVVRFVTSWATSEADVDELLAFAEGLAR
jgi:threonine aldolase